MKIPLSLLLTLTAAIALSSSEIEKLLLATYNHATGQVSTLAPRPIP